MKEKTKEAAIARFKNLSDDMKCLMYEAISEQRHLPPIRLDGYTEMFSIKVVDEIVNFAKEKHHEYNP